MAVILIVLVENSTSSSCGSSSKILTWTGKYKSATVARVGKYNLWTRVSK